MKILNKEFLINELKQKKALRDNLEVTFYKLQGQVDYLEALVKESEKEIPVEAK